MKHCATAHWCDTAGFGTEWGADACAAFRFVVSIAKATDIAVMKAVRDALSRQIAAETG